MLKTVYQHYVKLFCYLLAAECEVEACWAHNPQVRGSKPRSASFLFFLFNLQILLAHLLEAKINISQKKVTFFLWLELARTGTNNKPFFPAH